jgi:1,5-anhydro-D-fructose reductase (1,5-anhydro-D-mannitol-forming)
VFRVGICGFGKMGQIRADSLLSTGDVEIVKVYDKHINEDVKYAKAESFDEIIEDDSIDAICICLPNNKNYELTIKDLKQGKHVLCEKPPAFTVAQVEHIIQVEEESGKTLMYGFNHRHHDAVVRMKELLESGEFGKVLWMRGRYGKSVDDSYFNEWRADKDLAGGGILFDQGIHMLDLFLYLGGSFDQVHAFVSNLYWKLEGIEDNVFAIMKNSKTGLVASLHSTMTQWRHLFSLEIFLESGYMVLNGLKTGSGSYGEEVLTIARNRSKAPAATWSDEESFHFEIDNSWDREAQIFIDSIKQMKKPELGSSTDALNVMKLIEEIYENERDESESLNTEIKMSEKLNG